MIKYVDLNNKGNLTITVESANISYFTSISEDDETSDDDVVSARLFMIVPTELKNDSVAICAYLRKILFNYEITNNTELTGFEPMLRIEK